MTQDATDAILFAYFTSNLFKFGWCHFLLELWYWKFFLLLTIQDTLHFAYFLSKCPAFGCHMFESYQNAKLNYFSNNDNGSYAANFP